MVTGIVVGALVAAVGIVVLAWEKRAADDRTWFAVSTVTFVAGSVAVFCAMSLVMHGVASLIPVR